MNIVLTTILLFAVFGILLFIGCPISVGIVISSIVTAVSTLSWGSDYFHYHAENEQRCGEFLSSCSASVYPGR